MGQHLEKNKHIPIKVKECQALIGSLTYAAMSTRPDIAGALGVVNQFASNPNETHWKAVKRILRYLKGTLDYGICFCGNKDMEIKLSGFVDADWAGDVETRKSQSGYVFQLCGGPVSWVSKKQAVVALSTTEAEYVQLKNWCGCGNCFKNLDSNKSRRQSCLKTTWEQLKCR